MFVFTPSHAEKLKSLPWQARAALSFCAGALAVPALPPFNLWLCMLLGFSLFYVLLADVKTARGGFGFGWCFGFGYFGAGLWWIANALLVDGNEFRWVWPLAIAGLPALLAIFTAAGCAAFVRAADRKTLGGFLIFLAALMASEWLRGHAFTGFPWNLYGVIWSTWPAMMQPVALTGSYALALLTLAVTAAPGFLLIWPAPRRHKIAVTAALAILFTGHAVYGSVRLSHAKAEFSDTVGVRPVQPDITQEDKWNPEKAGTNLFSLLSLSAAPASEAQMPVTLIVWPETALTYHMLEDDGVRAALKQALAAYDGAAYLITGLLRYDPGMGGSADRYFNSLAVLDKNLNVMATYDKSHLVPFGEYVPLQKWLRFGPFVQMEGFTPGSGLTALAPSADIPAFSPLICYEVIFPHAVVPGGGDRPGWMVNLTNDAWYGDSPGPYQHFAQTRFRAIEEGMPLIRSANTGISGVIDPWGRVLSRAGLYEKTARTLALPRALPGGTLYGRFGDGPFFLMLILLLTAGLSVKKAHKYKFMR